MKEVIIEDKRTVDLAVEEGLLQLNTTRDNVTVEVLVAGGLFSKPKVKVTLRETVGSRARDFATKLIELMNIEGNIDLDETEEGATLTISGDDMGGIIGRRGEVLDSIQYLSSVVANLDTDKATFRRITVDCENYREKRTETLEALAERMVSKAIASGHRVALEPMNPHERRIIHIALQGNTEVTSFSEGDEPNRRLVIVPNNEKPFKPNHTGDRKSFNRNGNGNDRRNNNDRRNGNDRHGRNNDRRGYGNSNGFAKPANSGFSASHDFTATSGFSETELKGGKNYTSINKYNK